MDRISRLVQLSELFKAAQSIEELDRLRSSERVEINNMDKLDRNWLRLEWESARRMFDYPGLTDKEWKKIERESDGTNTDREEHARVSQQNRRDRGKLRYRERGGISFDRNEKSRTRKRNEKLHREHSKSGDGSKGKPKIRGTYTGRFGSDYGRDQT